MSEPVRSGSCACGEITYKMKRNPFVVQACHCTDCQTTSGSAFTLSMIVNAGDVEVLEGELAVNYLDNNGVEVKRHHCPQCGTALWYSADAYPGIYALKPGTFDDTKWFKPIAHLWMRSAQPWVVLDEEAKQYQKQPEMAELFDLWANRDRDG